MMEVKSLYLRSFFFPVTLSPLNSLISHSLPPAELAHFLIEMRDDPQL